MYTSVPKDHFIFADLVTKAIADALQILGHPRIYHMREVQKNNHIDLWCSLLDTKFSDHPRPLKCSDFDPILSNFDVCSHFTSPVRSHFTSPFHIPLPQTPFSPQS